MTMTHQLRHAENPMRRLELRMAAWLAEHSVSLLRVALGLVILGFGILKFVPGLSPAEGLAVRTLDILTFGLLPADVGRLLVATLETTIGLLLVTGLWMRAALLLLAVELVGILSPLAVLPTEMFRTDPLAPTLAGQYVMKDIILVAAGLVVAAQALGARMVTPEEDR